MVLSNVINQEPRSKFTRYERKPKVDYYEASFEA